MCFVDISLNTGRSSGYTKTGDMITLPFTEEAYVSINCTTNPPIYLPGSSGTPGGVVQDKIYKVVDYF